MEVILSSTARTRLYYIKAQSTDCDRACQLAEDDFYSGAYFIVDWGMPETKDEIMRDVLCDTHGITMLFGGCIQYDEVNCYNERVYALLQGKFGDDFYLEARKRVRHSLATGKKLTYTNADY